MSRRRKPAADAATQDAAPARAARKTPRRGKLPAAAASEPAGAAPAAAREINDHQRGTTPHALIRVPIDVRWRDLDAYHHVNNSTFLTYIEEARLQWFQSLPGPWVTEDTAPVLAASHLNYRRPIEWPAQLVVELSVERVGNTSLTLAHRIGAAHDASVLYSDGTSVLVWIDRSGRPASLPDAVRAAATRSG
jgi:acyl-CoA thioester hydrolase